MIDNPKEKPSKSGRPKDRLAGRGGFPGFHELRRLLNVEKTLQILGIILQIVIGFCVVTVSVLGLMQPLWLSAVMSILGSAAIMVGFYQLYYMIIRDHTFESLISRAIRRVVQFKN
ncbi:MAG: hypothetical protein WD599_01860 [Balneolaceae bacterium]